MLRFAPVLVVLAGCNFELPDARNCPERQAFYPDADGDGLGERTAVYVGCEAPSGWVTELEPLDTGVPDDTDVQDTDDTDVPVDTDTDVPTDTDAAR